MNEDEAFIRAIRETPDDETARLVYTDWLDDRDDPRGDYLRAEAEWVALQPSDEQYRSLFRQISQLAATLDPAWFAIVSRMGYIVQQAWKPLTFRLKPLEVINLPKAWEESAGQLRVLLAKSFGTEEVDRRFCAPADFVAFLCLIGGASDGWDYLQGSQGLVASNTTNISTFGPSQPAPDHWSDEEIAERPNRPEIWLEFGGWSDKHWYFICCDLESPLFGVTTEGEDYHPWMAGIEPLDFRGRNFLDFLASYQHSKQNPDWEGWPRVPHSQWGLF